MAVSRGRQDIFDIITAYIYIKEKCFKHAKKVFLLEGEKIERRGK